MTTRVTLFICVICALVLLTACGQVITTHGDDSTSGSDNSTSGSDNSTSDPDDSAYKKITAEEGKGLMESEAIFALVDVRRADEYETAHIPGAINIPNESIGSIRPDLLPDLNKIVVVYCRTGVRSKQAADKLVEMGYTDVRDMGGITDWPYDTISGKKPG